MTRRWYMGKTWTFAFFKLGNGSKQFSFGFWWNSQRIGLEAYFYLWSLTLMKEWK